MSDTSNTTAITRLEEQINNHKERAKILHDSKREIEGRILERKSFTSAELTMYAASMAKIEFEINGHVTALATLQLVKNLLEVPF